MSLIQIQGNTKYIEITWQTGVMESVSRKLTKAMHLEDVGVVLVMRTGDTIEIRYSMTLNPANSQPFISSMSLFNYLLTLYGSDTI